MFPLQTTMQVYHLMYPNMLLYMSECEYFFHLKKFLMLMNGNILAISGHDTLRLLGT